MPQKKPVISRSNRFIVWGLRKVSRACAVNHSVFILQKAFASFCYAQIGEPDQHHQDERDDIVASVWMPETGLLTDHAVGLPDRHNLNRLDKNDNRDPISEIVYTGKP